MGDLIFVAVVVAFFALTVAYVKGCELIVGRDAGVDAPVDSDADDAASAHEATGARP
jgi:hypothetical protein